MKKVLIAYFSQEGTTARLARHISQAFQFSGYEVNLYNILDGNPPDISQYDVLGIGSPVYILRPPFNIMEYIDTLPHLQGMPFFLFISNGSYPGNAVRLIRRVLSKKGGREVEYTRFTGEDYALISPELGYPKKEYRDSCRT